MRDFRDLQSALEQRDAVVHWCNTTGVCFSVPGGVVRFRYDGLDVDVFTIRGPVAAITMAAECHKARALVMDVRAAGTAVQTTPEPPRPAPLPTKRIDVKADPFAGIDYDDPPDGYNDLSPKTRLGHAVVFNVVSDPDGPDFTACPPQHPAGQSCPDPSAHFNGTRDNCRVLHNGGKGTCNCVAMCKALD